MTGWYELPDIFGIKAWERLISPHINQAGKMVHEAGALHCYMHTEGNLALAGQLLACEIDVIWGFDPYMGGDEMQPVSTVLIQVRRDGESPPVSTTPDSRLTLQYLRHFGRPDSVRIGEPGSQQGSCVAVKLRGDIISFRGEEPR